jgi:hypothetical protein
MVGLMTYLSGGEPFLMDDHFVAGRGIGSSSGYPLNRVQEANPSLVLEKAKQKFGPQPWLIAPGCRPMQECRERK